MSGSTEDVVDVVVVGAGFAGLYSVWKFRDSMGMTVRAFEAGDGVGGTWYWNRYPGARCDAPSYSYSFSFDPELDQEWEWTERFAPQAEIEAYLNHVADRYDLRSSIEFSTKVTAAKYDEATATWTVQTDTGTTVVARYLVTAVGCLSQPKDIDIEGAADFQGTIYRTFDWPKEDVDFRGKRVAVFGTGSSGIQVIPEIAKQADHLTVFQRTPNYNLPARNRRLTPEEVAEIKSTYPQYRLDARVSGAGVPLPDPEPSALAVSKAERDEAYQLGWDTGFIPGILNKYADLMIDKQANETAAGFIRDKIASVVNDPKVAQLLTPYDHAYGAKRPPLGDDYYESFNRENVRLIDLRTTPVKRITATGVSTTDEELEFDAIVFATGFDAMVGALNAIDLRGRGGVLLRDVWREGPKALLGVSVAGFPNLFTITGPGSPSVLSNVVVSIEQHVDWIADCLNFIDSHGASGIEATVEAQDRWVEHVNELANSTLFVETESWYTGSNVPGKPRVFMPYVGGVGAFRERCDEVAANDYEGFKLIDQSSA
jgi:cation diffusion facilitator CzcD-associated flavoprotein CzcO